MMRAASLVIALLLNGSVFACPAFAATHMTRAAAAKVALRALGASRATAAPK